MKLVWVSVHGFRILVLNCFANLDLGSHVSSDRTGHCRFQCFFLPQAYLFFFFFLVLDSLFYFTLQSVFTRMAVIKALEKIKEEDFLK